MAWQAVWSRVRTAFAAIRSRVTRRVVFRSSVAAMLVGTVLVTTEALIRGHLGTSRSRIPTSIYTRPIGWGEGGRRAPVALATVAGAPGELRVPIPIGDAPSHLVDAILAVEDKRFETHHGLDFRRIGGALVANIRAGRISQGGSTVTQQLVKNLFLSAERTPLRKLREAALALAIEVRHEKDEILEAYLNEIYLGQDGPRPIHGVGAAARFYFGKEVGRLTVAESALLAGMIQAPNRYTPIRNERSARRRRNLVLALMSAQGRISARTADQAGRARIGRRAFPAPSLDARYFRDFVLTSLPGGLPSRGGAVFTTIDPTLQRAADRAVKDGLRRLGSGDIQAALVAIDPRTGEVLAMVGGRDYGASQFNRAVEARRQPGSAFKPIVALAALELVGAGRPAFTLASRIEDEPLSVRTPGGRWEPSNYDRSYRGEVTFREAIEQSLNVPFARVGLSIGPERIIATARRLGIASPLKAVPSLALGSSEVTLLEMVRAYGVFATGGRLAAMRPIAGQAELGGKVRATPRPEPVRVAEPGAAYLVTSALEGVIARGTGRALDVSGRFGAIAGKTGTSNDWRDAWFIAYSPTLVVGAWVGYDDGRSLRLSGSDAALPIVARFLGEAEPENRWDGFDVPDGIEVAQVNGGGDWGYDCGSREYFLEGTAPETDCDRFEFRNWNGERHDEDDDDDEETAPRLQQRAGRAVISALQRLLERAAEEQRWRVEVEGRRIRARLQR
ncbi:MAG: transglycosylase domain-containing protein [Gemmatimonadales bacterium]